MSKTWQLPSFASAQPVTKQELSPDALEDTRLDAFEHGYKDGWEDAFLVADKEQKRLKSELIQSISDLKIPVEEARRAVFAELRPILTEIATVVAPATLQAKLVELLTSEIERMVDFGREGHVEIQVETEDYALIEPILKGSESCAISVRSQPGLQPGQAHLVYRGEETAIDCSSVGQQAMALVADYLSGQLKKENANG